MKIITILNEKGGVGKTTLATTIASSLAEVHGLSGLLFDTDGQGDCARAVGLSPSKNAYKFLIDMEEQTADLVERVPGDFCEGNLFIVGGNDEIRAIPMIRSVEQIQKVIKRRLSGIKVDFVIFDTQPSPTSLHSAIASITDDVIIPFDCEKFSEANLGSALENMRTINEMSRAAGLNRARVVGVIPNKFQQRTILHRAVLSNVVNEYGGSADPDSYEVYDYGDLVWKPIPYSIALATHQYMSENVMYENASHFLSQALYEMTRRVYETCFASQEGEVIRSE